MEKPRMNETTKRMWMILVAIGVMTAMICATFIIVTSIRANTTAGTTTATRLEQSIREIVREEYATYQTNLAILLSVVSVLVMVLGIGLPLYMQNQHKQELKAIKMQQEEYKKWLDKQEKDLLDFAEVTQKAVQKIIKKHSSYRKKWIDRMSVLEQ